MSFSATIVSLFLLASGAPASGAAEAATDPAPEIKDGDKVKCKYIQELHSRIPSKVCRTRAEWARIDEENREAARNNMRNSGRNAESGAVYSSPGNL